MTDSLSERFFHCMHSRRAISALGGPLAVIISGELAE